MERSEEFEPQNDRIDSRSLDIIENVFRKEVIFISNDFPVELILFDFEHRYKNPPKGHSYVRFDEIPLNDIALYNDREIGVSEFVLYPPLEEVEARRIRIKNRIKAVRKVEKAYGVKLKKMKDIDEYPTLSIVEIANAVDKEMLLKLNEPHVLDDKN